LLLVFGLIEFDLWCGRALDQDWLRGATYLAIAGVIWQSRRRQSVTETRRGSAYWALAVSLGATAMLAGMLAAAGWLLRESYEAPWLFLAHRPAAVICLWVLRKCVVVAAQQLVLQWFVWPSCREICTRRGIALTLTAGLFGLVHLPSLWLVGITVVAALIWVHLYERTGRIWPLIVSHFVLATLAHGVLPERLHYDMRVGSEAYEHLQRRRLAYSEETRTRLRVLTTDAYYQGHGGTAAGYVRALYVDVLQREPAAWEQALWQRNLQRLSRAEAAEAMLTCSEAQDRLRDASATR
jgi:membrane protease YdiL (CAAX protease family)